MSKRGLVMTDKKGLATLVAVQHQIIITLRRLKTKRVTGLQCNAFIQLNAIAFFKFFPDLSVALIKGRHLLEGSIYLKSK